MARRLINEHKRQRRISNRTILIGAEGKNKTENMYFHNFNDRQNSYRIIMANGNSTDPVRMVEDIITTMEKMDINPDYGDKVYCIFDTDESERKDNQIKDAMILASKNKIEVIISNPCFENWFLCHFIYTTKHLTNANVVQKLKKYIPNYAKNINVYSQLKNLTPTAINNAKKQCEYQKSLGRNIHKVQSNPCTEIYIIIEELNK